MFYRIPSAFKCAVKKYLSWSWCVLWVAKYQKESCKLLLVFGSVCCVYLLMFQIYRYFSYSPYMSYTSPPISSVPPLTQITLICPPTSNCSHSCPTLPLFIATYTTGLTLCLRPVLLAVLLGLLVSTTHQNVFVHRSKYLMRNTCSGLFLFIKKILNICFALCPCFT